MSSPEKPKRSGPFGSKRIPFLPVFLMCSVSFGGGFICATMAVAGNNNDNNHWIAPHVPYSDYPAVLERTMDLEDLVRDLILHTVGDEIMREDVSQTELKREFQTALRKAFAPTGAAKSSQPLVLPKMKKKLIHHPDPNAVPKSKERDFLSIARRKRTLKVEGYDSFETCKKDDTHPNCVRQGCQNPKCKVWGHFYDTIYQRRLGHLSTDDTEPFQFLEIGFDEGDSLEAYMEWLPKAEVHSMEISCLPPGPRDQGKWPFGNNAAKNPLYKTLIKRKRLHCGDAYDVNWLHQIWTNEMNRKNAPPLNVVVDDGSHLDYNMAQSVFFWFPRIASGGMLVIENVQPIRESNRFRTQILPQLMADLHFCGDSKISDDGPCFPTIQPLLASVHCELHICILERNDEPAVELSLEHSKLPSSAMDASNCPSLRL
jgi:hypothetical protein